MIVGIALILGLIGAWALGADLSRLSALRFRGEWLVFAALAMQVVLFTGGGHGIPSRYNAAVHLGSYLLLLLFIALNLRISGFWMVGVGVLANVIAIFANGGSMPVTLQAWRASGADPAILRRDGVVANNVLAGPHTHLAWLGDIFAIPSAVPFSNAVSIGDVLIVLGTVAFVYRNCSDLPPFGVNVLQPLSHAGFRRVMAGRITSKLGDWLTQAAIVTWIFAETRSTTAVGVFLITRMLGATAGGILSAPLLTRLEGFRVLSLVELARGVVTLAIIPLAVAGQIWPVVGLACLSSLLSAATSPSAAGLIPEVLPGELVQAGNALHGVGRNLTLVIGAGLGGLLVARFGIGVAMAVDLVTFVAAGLLYWTYAIATGAADGESEPERPRVNRRDLARVMLSSRVVLGLIVSFTVATAAFGIFNVSLPQLFESQLGQPDAYGFALAMLGVGFLCSELLTGFMQRESVARRSIFLSFLTTAGLMFVISHSTVTATVFLMLFLVGATDGITEVVYDTLIQLHVRRDLRAGVFAVAESVQNLGMVAGMAAAPVLVSINSAGWAVRVAAVGCAGGAALAGFALVRRSTGDDLLYVPDHAAVETSRAAIGGAAAVELATPVPPVMVDGQWPVVERPVLAAVPVLADVEGAANRKPVPVAMNGVIPPFELVAPAGRRRWLRELVEDGPIVLVLTVESNDAARNELVLALRDDDVEVVVVSLDGAGHTYTGALAFESLAAPRGGLFVVDRGCRLRLAFAADRPGEWVPLSTVQSRLRRLVAA